MLTRLYVETLLVDEAQADQVWGLWNAGVITDDLAAWAWSLIFGARHFAVRQPTETGLYINARFRVSVPPLPTCKDILSQAFEPLLTRIATHAATQSTKGYTGNRMAHFFTPNIVSS
jgi:hypothetical protein